MKVSVHWYRHGLRLHDNPALVEAIRDADEVYPVFIFDGKVAGTYSAGYNRWRFLHECLQDLDESYKKAGGRLYVFQGEPLEIFSNIFKEWNVTQLTFEEDPEPIWTERDKGVKALCKQMNVEWVEKVSHTLWNPKDILSANRGSPPLTYESFCNVIEMLGVPERPLDDADLTKVNLPASDDHDNKFGLPTLEMLGIEPECEKQLQRHNIWIGGESQALEQLATRKEIERKAFECDRILPMQSAPDLLGQPMSCSAHLRFGCLSIRKFYWAICDQYKQVKDKKPPSAVVSQFIWREYFYTMSVNNINYNSQENNPICLKVPWYEDDEKLQKWKNAKTGYPWIDACMTQLLVEGWIHHVARHAVACFLTRGDLWLSWEHGDKFFNRYQLDADWSVCAGNWMWIASSAFEQSLDCPKCFCPVRYGQTMDPTGAFVRRYLPILSQMPLKYLFNPWKAPPSVQKEAGCIVGEDYPERIVDHLEVSKKNRTTMLNYKNSLSKREPHCGPASEKEVDDFAWLTISAEDKCTANNECQKLHVE
ncbi:cryptochrome-1-like isoform X2 [Lineus longissimus]